MRIVSGQYKGKPIATPEGNTTRPTSDRARESVFNILEHAAWAPRLKGARVLDLFAGSGALGLEALSRGAAFCLFVETDEGARGAIRDNVEALQLFGCTRIHRRDATDLGPRPSSAGAPFDLVFLDPPYAKGPQEKNLGERALAELARHAWAAPGAVLVFERGEGEPDITPPGYDLIDERRYGAAKVLFLKWPG
ncbi:MAG: 16S rRNA (guanine(966)-N(2))-methyltransferase RsmD [Caulobacteraceae bacterium]